MRTSTTIALIIAAVTNVAIIGAGCRFAQLKRKPQPSPHKSGPCIPHPARRVVIDLRTDRATPADMDWLECNLLMDGAVWDAAIDFDESCKRDH